jgi:hypothetical protein
MFKTDDFHYFVCVKEFLSDFLQASCIKVYIPRNTYLITVYNVCPKCTLIYEYSTAYELKMWAFQIKSYAEMSRIIA